VAGDALPQGVPLNNKQGIVLTSLLSILTFGFLLGMRHATDADHVIAVSTIVSRQRNLRAAAWTGVMWGLGHSATILLVGGAIVFLDLRVSPRFTLVAEFLAATMLVAIGAFNLRELTRWLQLAKGKAEGVAYRRVIHAHGDYVHRHTHPMAGARHAHAPNDTPLARADTWWGSVRQYRMLRPLVVGVIHGLAGSAAVTLLVLAAIQQRVWAIAYLLVFGFGTIAGMALVTLAICAPFVYSAGRLSGLQKHFRTAFGLASVTLGLYLMHHVGFVDGLFTW
jgi:hypothetical protein